MKPNKHQVITLIISIPILILLFIYNSIRPDSVHPAYLILVIVFVVIIFFGLRTLPEINDKIIWKRKSLELLEKQICPFCEKNQIGEYRIRIGYRKKRSPIKYFFFWIEINFSREELATSSAICEWCKNRFLGKQLPEPSLTVLEMKPGYLRGLPRPHEKGHIFKPELDNFLSNI